MALTFLPGVVTGRTVNTYIESLEARIAPAGLVRLHFSDGILTLTGDDSDNMVTVTKTDGITKVKGKNDTDIRLDDHGVKDVISFKSDVKTVKAVLNDGDDILTVNGKYGGNLSYKAGGADDTLRLNDTRFGGSVNMSGADGVDLLSINYLKVNGPMNINLGNGNDVVLGTTLRAYDSVTFSLGDGDNRMRWSGDVNINGDLNVWANGGDDVASVDKSKLEVDGDIDVDLGSGSNYTNITGNDTDSWWPF